MNTIIRLFCVLGFLEAGAFGCLQRYGTSVDGEHVRSFRVFSAVRQMTNAPRTDWVRDEQSLRPYAMATNATFKHQSDYAATLLHLGRVKEAIAILEPLVKRHEGEYEINANLGTAYELDGQLEKALHYISRGIEINDGSHMGTEWLHVKILEAKIALAKNPEWLRNNSVLGFSFGEADVPVLPLALKGDPKEGKARKVADAIIYQMQERLQFVKPPDATVHDLLFDLGNIVAVDDVVESAIPIYQFAATFGTVRKPLIDRRVSHFRSLSRWNVQKFAHEYPGAIAISAIGGVLGVYVWARCKRKARV